MKDTIIANRYARALFDLALEKDMLETVKGDMELLISTVRQSRDLKRMLKSPVIRTDRKIAIIRELFGKRMDEISLRYIEIITRNGRETFLEGIAAEFITLYRKHMNIIAASLTTAVRVDDDIRNRIVNLLEKETGATIELSEKVDHELIGGFILTFGDKQYDASLKRQIKRLRKEFDINLYIRGF